MLNNIISVIAKMETYNLYSKTFISYVMNKYIETNAYFFSLIRTVCLNLTRQLTIAVKGIANIAKFPILHAREYKVEEKSMATTIVNMISR